MVKKKKRFYHNIVRNAQLFHWCILIKVLVKSDLTRTSSTGLHVSTSYTGACWQWQNIFIILHWLYLLCYFLEIFNYQDFCHTHFLKTIHLQICRLWTLLWILNTLWWSWLWYKQTAFLRGGWPYWSQNQDTQMIHKIYSKMP